VRLVRFRMRSVLVAVAVLAVALGWWLRPQVVEVLRDDGSLAARFQVRRNWRGERVAQGTQEWFLPDGQCFRRQVVVGPRLVDGQFLGSGQYGEPVYPPHFPPDPPSAEYVGWLRHDDVPISTDLPSTAGERFSYP
jgi:hypothetical protein